MTTEVLAVVLAVVFGVAGTAKIGGAPVMRTAAQHLGYSVDQYRVIGALELAGAIGLLVGLVAPAIGVVAASADRTDLRSWRRLLESAGISARELLS